MNILYATLGAAACAVPLCVGAGLLSTSAPVGAHAATAATATGGPVARTSAMHRVRIVLASPFGPASEMTDVALAPAHKAATAPSARTPLLSAAKSTSPAKPVQSVKIVRDESVRRAADASVRDTALTAALAEPRQRRKPLVAHPQIERLRRVAVAAAEVGTTPSEALFFARQH